MYGQQSTNESTTTHEKRQSSSSVPRNPVRAAADELDAVIDCPRHPLCCGPPALALLVAEDHRLLRAEFALVVCEHLDVAVERVHECLGALQDAWSVRTAESESSSLWFRTVDPYAECGGSDCVMFWRWCAGCASSPP